MSNRLYKYQIWNSNWYKKTVSQVRVDWEKAVSNESGETLKEVNANKRKNTFLNDFFPWWRQER